MDFTLSAAATVFHKGLAAVETARHIGGQHSPTSQLPPTTSPQCWKAVSEDRSLILPELPKGCRHHFITVEDRFSALVLTKDLYAKLKLFTTEFQRLQRLEKMYAAEIETCNKLMDECKEARARANERMDFMQRTLRQQGDKPEIWDNVQYFERDIDKAESEMRGLADDYDDYFEAGEDAFRAIQQVRLRTIQNQYELANLLHESFVNAGLIDTLEQWQADRRGLQPLDLRGLHWRANLERAPQYLQDHVDRVWDRHDRCVSPNDDNDHDEKEEGPRAGRKLVKAMDEFERCMWNRAIARDEFDHRRYLVDLAKENYGPLEPVGEDMQWYAQFPCFYVKS